MGTGTSCEEVPPSAQSGRDAVAAALTDDNYSVEDGVHSTSNAVLYAHKFTQRHPLLQWNDTENVVHGMGTRSSKLLVLVDICDMSGEVSSRVVLSVMSSSSSLLLSTAHPSGYKLKALLVSVRHPCLLPVLDVDKQHGGHGIFIMAQPFVPTGSIKDLIYCNPVPAKGYASKYSRVGRGLPRTLISRYGRHVLEALRALRSIGVVCDHLKTSNVMLDQDVARISDIFNPILGLSRDRSMQALTMPLEATVPLDILLFGHFLFEMAVGRELNAVVPRESDVAALPVDIANVLASIFGVSTVSPCSVEHLLAMPLFAAAPPMYLFDISELLSGMALLESSNQLNAERRSHQLRQFHVAAIHAARTNAGKGTDGGKEKAVLPTSRGAKKPPPLKRMSYRRASSSVMA